MRWGLIPYWAKDPSIGLRTINAKAETITTAPAFREVAITRFFHTLHFAGMVIGELEGRLALAKSVINSSLKAKAEFG